MKKYKMEHLNLLPLIILSLLFFKVITEANLSFKSLLSFIYSSSAYFIWGVVIAFLFNPLMVFFDELIASKRDSKKMKRIKRIFIISFLYLSFFWILALFFMAFIPMLMDGIEQVLNRIPEYVSSVQDWSIRSLGRINKNFENIIDNYLERVYEILYNIINGINLSSISDSLTQALSGSVTAFMRVFFGFGISVYFLYSKENLLFEIKKFLYAILPEDRARRIMRISKNINIIFSNFVASKIIESVIMFIIGMVVLYFLDIPLAAFISFIIAVTNIIPYFGPYIGAVPSVLIALMYDPVKALWVILYAVGIQLIDNFIIGPKVTSDKVGISPILVIAGVTIGGSLFGIFGMFLGVPTIAAFKSVFYDSFIERRLAKKHIDENKLI